ncbi:MAG: hypothetical protein RJA36_3879, partial [Pseudomonadota bacterium]
ALVYIDERFVPDAEILQTLANPWILFEPRRIWVPEAAGGSPQTSTLTEPTTSTDALAALYAAVASQSEAAAVADDLAAALTSPAALTEAAAAADATTAVVTLLAVLTEAASLADALAALLVAVADVAEPATAVELLSTGAQYAGTLLEEITATDTMAAAATLVALLTEPATAADAAAGSYPATYTCSVAELASVLEQMVAVLGTEVFTASARTRIGPATLMDAAERIGSRTTVPGLASRVGGKSI